MTEKEETVIHHLIAAWNAFAELPVEHNDDLTEFRQGIHALQAKVMARPARRTFNGQTVEICSRCGVSISNHYASGFIAKCGNRVIKPRQDGCPGEWE